MQEVFGGAASGVGKVKTLTAEGGCLHMSTPREIGGTTKRAPA